MNVVADTKQIRTYIEIVEQITAGIRAGELKPADKLPSERDLSVQFGIGRQCLREALSVMAASGLIEVRKGRGTFVHTDALINIERLDLDTEAVGDPFALMQARLTIEKETARLAALMYQQSDVLELDAIASEMSRAINHKEHAGDLDKRLHLSIAKMSRNPVYYKIMSDLIANMGKKLWVILKERSLLVEGRVERYYSEHMRLIQAVKDGDSKLAEKIMTQHLVGVEHDLKN